MHGLGYLFQFCSVCKRHSREALAAQSEQSLSVAGTEIYFFFSSRRLFATLVCLGMLKPNLPVVLLLSQSVVIFELTACVLQPGLHRSLDTLPLHHL